MYEDIFCEVVLSPLKRRWREEHNSGLGTHGSVFHGDEKNFKYQMENNIEIQGVRIS